MDQKNYTRTYKENQRLELELKNMYMLVEENKDLKEDLDRLRNMTYEQKVKDITKTNRDLMKRNGTLLMEVV